jgi:hypothetical protein
VDSLNHSFPISSFLKENQKVTANQQLAYKKNMIFLVIIAVSL